MRKIEVELKDWHLLSALGNCFVSPESSVKYVAGIIEDNERKFIQIQKIVGIVDFGEYKILETERICYRVFPENINYRYEEAHNDAFLRLK